MLNKEQVITMFKEGLTRKEIAEKLGCTLNAVQKCIKKNCSEEIENKKTSIESLILSMYRDGNTCARIAEKLNCTQQAIDAFIKKNCSEEIKSRKEAKKETSSIGYHSSETSYWDVAQRTFSGNNPNVSNISDRSLLECCRTAYITQKKNGTLKFSEQFGLKPSDVPKYFKPTLA